MCSADRILDAVWEDETPTIKAVQFHLSKLRDVLVPGRARGSDGTVIATTPAGYVAGKVSFFSGFGTCTSGIQTIRSSTPIASLTQVGMSTISYCLGIRMRSEHSPSNRPAITMLPWLSGPLKQSDLSTPTQPRRHMPEIRMLTQSRRH